MRLAERVRTICTEGAGGGAGAGGERRVTAAGGGCEGRSSVKGCGSWGTSGTQGEYGDPSSGGESSAFGCPRMACMLQTP